MRTSVARLSRAVAETLEERMMLSLAPAGGEFRLNPVTGTTHDNVAVAADGDGDFVAAWESSGQDGSLDGVFARRFNASGAPQEPEFRVNTYTTGVQSAPAVAMDVDGDFVIAWSSSFQDGSLDGIFAQRYNAAGIAQGTEFRVNTVTFNSQAQPTIAMDAAGNFVVGWYSVTSGVDIYAQRYDFAGAKQGGEFLVNSTTGDNRSSPAAAMDADGDFVIAWASANQDGSSYGIYARRFHSSGAAQGGEFRVNTFTTGLQLQPSVAMNIPGDFVVTWTSPQDGDSYGVYAQRYNASGVPQGDEFPVNAYTTSSQLSPVVATDADGDFLITWNSSGQDGDGYGVYARHYSKTGAPISAEFRVNTTTTLGQVAPSIAADHKGDFIIGWHGNGASDPEGVYAQRYAESVDTGGPIVAGVFVNGRRVLPYNVIEAPVSQLVVSFSENMTDAGGPTGANSVTNAANWLFTRNGADITSGLSISYGFNPAANRFEAAMNLGESFTSGNILVKARDNIRDVAGNRLDGNVDGVAGGALLLPFSVGSIGPQAGNTFITNSQSSPAVAVDAARNFVVAWTSVGQDGDGNGVYARRYNSAGVGQGGEFPVNTTTAGSQLAPAVAMDVDGDFVIAWSGNGPGDAIGVFAQRYNAAGVAQGGEFRVNSFTTNQQFVFSVAMDAGGAFVITWQSDQDGSANGSYAQRYNAAGVAQGGEFRVNSFTSGIQAAPSIAMDVDGDFVIAWESLQDGSYLGVYGQRYNAAGLPQGGEFRVNSFTIESQRAPSVAMDADGDFVVVWESYAQDGNLNGIFAQRYNASGLREGSEFPVNSFTTDNQRFPSVAMDADGDFIVTWQSYAQDGDRDGVHAQRYNASGLPLESEFRVNSFTTDNQSSPSVTMDPDGEFIVAWRSVGLGDFFQRYGLHSTPAVNTLTDTPDPVSSGNAITLSAGGVISSDGTLSSVSLSRESNGDPGLQVGFEGDTLVGSTSTNVGGFWSINVSTASLANGTYTYWAQATDDAGLIGASASTTNSVIGAAPAVSASSFVFETPPQRPMFTFDQNVSASLSASDFTGIGTPGVDYTLSYDGGTNTATLSFTHIFADANYTATIIAAGVTNAGGTPMAANHDLPFFTLGGDANRDRTVDITDLGILATNWLQSPRTFSQGDFNHDGTVDITDLGILATNWRKTLAPPPAQPGRPDDAERTQIGIPDPRRQSLRESVLNATRLASRRRLIESLDLLANVSQ